jgi:hypothetical protein
MADIAVNFQLPGPVDEALINKGFDVLTGELNKAAKLTGQENAPFIDHLREDVQKDIFAIRDDPERVELYNTVMNWLSVQELTGDTQLYNPSGRGTTVSEVLAMAADDPKVFQWSEADMPAAQLMRHLRALPLSERADAVINFQPAPLREGEIQGPNPVMAGDEPFEGARQPEPAVPPIHMAGAERLPGSQPGRGTDSLERRSNVRPQQPASTVATFGGGGGGGGTSQRRRTDGVNGLNAVKHLNLSDAEVASLAAPYSGRTRKGLTAETYVRAFVCRKGEDKEQCMRRLRDGLTRLFG